MSEDLDIAEQTEQQKDWQKEEFHEARSALTASEPESEQPDELNAPEFRSHTSKNNLNAARYTPIYRVGKGVYLKGARSLRGPYTIARVNSDGTYSLNDESGKPFKDKVEERDLKPV